MPDNNFLIPAPISMEALTDCAVLCIPIEDILRFQKKYFKEITLLELRLINDSWNLHLELKRGKLPVYGHAEIPVVSEQISKSN